MAEEEITFDLAQLKKLKVPQLKQHLSEFGLETKGNKAELVERLERFLHEQEESELLEGEEEEEAEDTGEIPDDITGEEVPHPLESAQPEDQPTLEESEKVGVASEPAAAVVEEEPTDDVQPAKTKISLTGISQEDRVQMRAKRFGNSSEDAKKAARAARFGTSLENGYKGLGKHPPSAEDLEKMKKRGERFGSNVAPSITKGEEDERKKKRIERFGTTVTELSMEERKKARAARFGAS